MNRSPRVPPLPPLQHLVQAAQHRPQPYCGAICVCAALPVHYNAAASEVRRDRRFAADSLVGQALAWPVHAVQPAFVVAAIDRRNGDVLNRCTTRTSK